MVPVVVLAIIAVAIIKSLMSVVARDEVATVAPWSPDYSTTIDPTIALRATTNDDSRAFLLPAVPEPATDPTDVDRSRATERTRSPS
jgi:hypothetical protein